MRKISFEASNALMQNHSYKNANTEVSFNTLSLHGNEIAKVINGELWISASGWFTSTTKERLNALPDVHIVQKAGVWYLNGKMWDGYWIKIS